MFFFTSRISRTTGLRTDARVWLAERSLEWDQVDAEQNRSQGNHGRGLRLSTVQLDPCNERQYLRTNQRHSENVTKGEEEDPKATTSAER
jgi:hypothetical protein